MASKKKLTKAAKDKRSFRSSEKWRSFRKRKYDIQGGKDWITLKPLTKCFNCHHCNLDADEYQNLEDEGNFLALNKSTHDTLHWCLRYVKAFHSMEVMDRLYTEVKREAILNGFIDEDD